MEQRVEIPHSLIPVVLGALYVLGATLTWWIPTSLMFVSIWLLFYSCHKATCFICAALNMQMSAVALEMRGQGLHKPEADKNWPVGLCFLPSLTKVVVLQVRGVTEQHIGSLLCLCWSFSCLRISSGLWYMEFSVWHVVRAAQPALLGLQQWTLASVLVSNTPNQSDLHFTVPISHLWMKSACNQGCQ